MSSGLHKDDRRPLRAFGRGGPLAALLILCATSQAWAGPGLALVQHKTNFVQAVNTNQVAVTVAATGTGNLLIVLAGGVPSTTTITGVTDNAGGGSNVYVQVPAARATDTASDQFTDVWYVKNSKSGATTVTITYSVSDTNFKQAFVLEVSGTDTTAPVDVVGRVNNGSDGAGTIATGGSVTTTNASDFVASVILYSSGVNNIHAGNAFTSADIAQGNASAYDAAGSTGTYAPQWDDPGGGTFASSTVAFKAAPAVGYSTGSFVKKTSGAPDNCPANCTQMIPHGLGQTPKAIIVWTEGKTNQAFSANYLLGYGFSDGTTSGSVATASQNGVTTAAYARRMANKVLTIVQWGPATLAEADLGGGGCAAKWDATSFCLNWTTNDANAYVVHFIAISGSAVTAKVVLWTTPTVVNNSYAINTVGFQPTVVLHAFSGGVAGALPVSQTSGAFGLGAMDFGGDQWATAFYNNSGFSQRAQLTNAAYFTVSHPASILKQASWKSMDPTGFTMNFTAVDGTASDVFSLALSGVNGWIGSFLKIPSAPALVTGQAVAKTAGAMAQVQQAFPAASATGNLIVATVQWDSATVTAAPTLTDSNNNTYNVAVAKTDWGPSSSYHSVTYYASNIAGGATPITITAQLTGASTSFFHLYQFEYAGVSTVNPLDQASSASGTTLTGPGFAFNSGSKTTTQASELIYGFGAASTGTVAKGATFTTRSSFSANIAEDKSVAAIASYNADFANSGTANWVAQMATFKAAQGVQPITGVGFQPGAVMLTSFQDVATGPETQNRFGLGSSDGVTEGSSALEELDAAGTTNVQGIDKTTKVFMKVNNSTPAIDAEADLTSMDADGFTLNWTTNDAAATQILYLGLADQSVTAVRLVSFDAAKYNRGVLLQWKTGYEIDNLGFNLYREVNGVRTRVNASVIAGSGLMAGHGVAVNAVQAYARWDLDAAAQSGDVVYWLEDLDFGGKSTMHGPITPVAGAVNAPEPTVAQSSDLSDLGKSSKVRKIFLEHGEAEAGRNRRGWTAQPQSQTDTQWALAGHAAVKIGIKAPGWYRVSQADLLAAGLDPRTDPRRLRLFVDGVEQAMRVTGEADGRFDAGDAIEFYATGLDTPYTDTRVYWLAAGAERGQRIDVTGSAAGAAGAKSGPQSFWLTAHRKDRSVFFAALKNGDKENWFGPMVSGEPTDLTITADNIDRATTAPAQLEVTLQGVTSSPDGSANHSVGVLVNGTEVGQMTFAGQTDAVQIFAVPTSVLIDGENTVSLIARGGEADYSLVDLIRLSYWHTYRADADLLRFTVDAAGPVTIGGFASPAIRVVDITDPSASTELRGTIRSEAGGFSSVTVRAQGQGPRTLLAFSDATIATPASLQANHPSTWHARTHAHNWVAISHSDFLEQANPLATLREQQGYHTAVIDVDDLYDEFSFGEKTPQALKDFLQFAKANWRQAPRFVVLVGDATIDPRDYAQLGNADFVPTKQVPMMGVALETASDDWFVDFNGDGLPDLPIGRLSVRTADQAKAMVAKIVSYDENRQEPWTKSVLLVADANDDSLNFEHYSNNLEALLPAAYTAQPVFRGVLGDDAAHQALLDGVNAGQLIVNYVGHGSSRIWGSNGELLTNDDVYASLHNTTRLPFVVAMNCLNGLFDAIWDEESLAEAWTRAPDGGAVAAWASSSVTPAATQAVVNKELFRLIFQGAYATLGEAVAAAKRVVSSQDLRRSWIFFGDPAMHLSGTPLPVIARTPASPTVLAAAAVVTSHRDNADRGSKSSETVDVSAVLNARGEPVRLMDFNGDGRADLLLYAAATGRWAGVFNDAAGVSARAGSWAPGWQVVAANLNGDSRTDLIFYKPDTSEWVQSLTTADGASVVTHGTLPGSGPHALVRVGDFDGDQRDDLLIYDPDSGSWTIGLNDGHGGFTSRRGTWPSGLRIQIADFNRDGLADIFGYDPVTGRGTLILNSRDGRSTATTADWGCEWRVTVANLGGKTRADLLFYNPTSGAWQAAINDGLGHFAVRTGTWARGLEIHTGDFDGDRRDDVLGYNPVTGEWLTAMNLTSGQFPAVAGGAWTPGLSIATGDVNADGRDDVVLYDSVTGIWFEGMTVSPGVFAFGSGTWLPGASLIGRPR